MNNPMMGSGRRGGLLSRAGNSKEIKSCQLSNNLPGIEVNDMEGEEPDNFAAQFQKNLEATERQTQKQKRTLTIQPKKSEKIRSGKNPTPSETDQMEPIVEVEEEKGEVIGVEEEKGEQVELEFEDGEQLFTVVYFGPNAVTSGSVNSILKFVGTKKEGGFVVIDDNKVYLLPIHHL